MPFTLTVLAGVRLAVCTLPADAPLSAWTTADPFFSVTRTPDELSVICTEQAVPAGVQVEPGWRVLQVNGPFDFEVTGVLAELAAPLAAAGIPCLALATYQTDYRLVKAERLAAAVDALHRAGHTVHTLAG
jgi:hypothetical protein